MKRSLIGLAMGLLVLSVFAEDKAVSEKQLPTIFVAPLDGDMSQIQAWQPALGEGLAEMLITELGKTNKFQVLESTAIKDLVGEIHLGEEGYVGKDERVEKGGFSGADFMFRGKVTRFGSKEQGIGLGGFAPGGLGSLGIKTTTADVRVDWRVVDTYTRKVIKTGQATASEKGTGFNVGVGVRGSGGNIGFSNKEFMGSALGKATVKAVNELVKDVSAVDLPESGRSRQQATTLGKKGAEAQAAQELLRQTPGKVLAVVNKSTLIVSLGSKNGFKDGDKLKLYEPVETKDDKGVVVFTEEKLAGEITLASVQEERSKATYDGSAQPKIGWTVKLK